MRTATTLPVIVIGAGLALIPYAFGQEPKNPIEAVWDAIYELQNRDQMLQAQIDDLRTESPTTHIEAPLSEVSAEVDIESTPASAQMAIKVNVHNEGPERAAGVRLTLFYKMPLFHVEDMYPEHCRNLERGIIQCDLGTIEAGAQVPVLISLTPANLGVPTNITVDVSSTTEDKIPSNNHLVVDLVTGMEGAGFDDARDEESEATTGSDTSEEASSVSQNQTSSEPNPEDDENASSTSNGGDENTEEQGSAEASGEDQQTSGESTSSEGGASDETADDESQETPSTGNQTSSENQGG